MFSIGKLFPITIFLKFESAFWFCHINSQYCYIISESRNCKNTLISSKYNVLNSLSQMFGCELNFYFLENVKVVWFCSDLE